MWGCRRRVRRSYQDQRGVEEHGGCSGCWMQLLSTHCLFHTPVSCSPCSCRARWAYCNSLTMQSLLDAISFDVIMMVLPYCEPNQVLLQIGVPSLSL